MSRVGDLGKNFENLPAILLEYEEDIELLSARIKIQHKTMRQAQQDQIEWPYYYDQKRVELKILLKYMNQQLASLHGKMFRESVEKYSRELSDKGRDRYIMCTPEYNNMAELVMEVEEMYEKYEAAAEAFRLRGFTLRDKTTLITNSLQDAIA